MEISLKNEKFRFKQVNLIFEPEIYENVFAQKNNKSLAETLLHKRYSKFKSEIYEGYSSYLNYELGKFLLELKTNGDNFYLNFLNKSGDKKYCHFYISEESYFNKKGIYLYSIEGEVKYIGRCRDSFKKRINQGYGKITPKNCYIDGQSTNCNLNSLITEQNKSASFFVFEMTDNNQIEQTEIELIEKYSPEWNISLKQKAG